MRTLLKTRIPELFLNGRSMLSHRGPTSSRGWRSQSFDARHCRNMGIFGQRSEHALELARLQRCQARRFFGNRARIQANGRCGEQAFETTSPLLPNLTSRGRYANYEQPRNCHHCHRARRAQPKWRIMSSSTCSRISSVLSLGPVLDQEAGREH